jgi:hypothetical protein
MENWLIFSLQQQSHQHQIVVESFAGQARSAHAVAGFFFSRPPRFPPVAYIQQEFRITYRPYDVSKSKRKEKTMERQQALKQAQDCLNGLGSVRKFFFGEDTDEDLAETILLAENPEPAPTFQKRTLTAIEQRQCDEYIREIKIRKFLPGPETVLDGGDGELGLSKPQGDPLTRAFRPFLENEIRLHADALARQLVTGASIPSRSLSKRASSDPGDVVVNSGERVERDVIDGIAYISVFKGEDGPLLRTYLRSAA